MDYWRIRYAQLRRLLADRNVQLGLLVLAIGGGAAIVVLFLFPREAPSTVVAMVVSATASFAGAYLSYTVVVRHLISTERERIDPPEAIANRYSDTLALLEPTRLAATVEMSVPERLPVVTMETTASYGSRLAFDVVLTDDVYDLPASIRGFFGPYVSELEDRFETEGKFNSRKARLDCADETTLHVGETTYFRTFCTNFAPDLTFPNGGPTLREEFHNEFVENDRLVSMANSPFSNHLGGGGLLITTDGFAVLGIRAADVTVGERIVGNSFGGNFEYQNLQAGSTPEDELVREAIEEVEAVDESAVRELVPLALIRRVDWLGKPDIHSIALVDELETHAHTPEEYYDGISVDLGIDRLESADELFDPETARICVERIATASERATFSPGVNLLMALEFWLRAAEGRPSTERRE